MSATPLHFGTWRLAACSLLLLAQACSNSTGGGGGSFVPKDGAAGDIAKSDTGGAGNDTTATGTDAIGGNDASDVQSNDVPTVGTDAIAVEIIDTPDVPMTQDTAKDTKPDAPDIAKSDTPSTGKCIAAGTCDPVKNDCTGSGEACDIGSDGAAGCFPPPNDVAVGGACDNQAGPFCKGGYHCGANNTCQKFCCSASDCGSGKACTPLGIVQTDAIGICDP
jgi:hypothetical protein